MERRGQRFGVEFGVGGGTVVEGQPGDGEDPEGYEHRRHRGIEHVADVGEDVDTDGRGGEHRGIGQERDLVAEIGSGDDRSGNPPFGESHGASDSHQRHADGGDGGPRTAGHERHDGADRARCNKEKRRMQDLQSVVDQRGDDTRDHPRSGDGADEQQDQDGRRRSADVVDDGLFEHGPAAAVDADREHHADRRGRQQGDLASAVDGIAAEGADHNVEQGRQDHQRDGRDPGRRRFPGGRFHIRLKNIPTFPDAKVAKSGEKSSIRPKTQPSRGSTPGMTGRSRGRAFP